MSAAVVILLLSVFSIALGDRCLDCMCNLESQCQPIGCHWDDDAVSCGYFQIKLGYYQDCGQPWQQDGESVEDAWKRCADNKECSIECINNYISRYGGNCPDRSDCERMARLHNGGPNGCNGAQWYWGKIQECMAG